MKKEILEALTIIEEEENRTEKDIEIIRKAKQEIERLNNIINELEDYLVSQLVICPVSVHKEYQKMYHKLQELKGSDKE